MKLRNKKTGEINLGDLHLDDFNSLAELNEEWEDYDENKYYYAITSIKADAGITKMKNIHNDMTAFDKSIGNYFENREEAERAVEKLKAWKRLKDKGFKFDGYTPDFEGFWAIYPNDTEGTWCLAEDKADLDLLFGGEDDKK